MRSWLGCGVVELITLSRCFLWGQTGESRRWALGFGDLGSNFRCKLLVELFAPRIDDFAKAQSREPKARSLFSVTNGTFPVFPAALQFPHEHHQGQSPL